jgi:kinesin family protein C1
MHLGDCIGSLGSNTVVSWRNSRLTYLLQNFLSGEGAKMLMLVMISDREEHVSETNNSLRFASKVNATQIGTAKKRLNPAT